MIRRTGLILAGAVIVLDQLSKWWVVERLMRPEGVTQTPFFTPERIEITGFLNVVMTWNRGVSFGILNNDGPWNAWVLSGLSVVITIALGVWLWRCRAWLGALALGSIMGGALGNVIDRLRWGAVADFVDAHLASHHWPAFNLADSAITIGAVLLVLDALSPSRNSAKN